MSKNTLTSPCSEVAAINPGSVPLSNDEVSDTNVMVKTEDSSLHVISTNEDSGLNLISSNSVPNLTAFKMWTPRKVTKTLSLGDKVKAIEMYEQIQSSRKVGEAFGVSKDQIRRLMKRKSEVLDDYASNSPCERKRKMRKTGNEQINELTWKWYSDMTTKRIKVNRSLIQAQALCFAGNLGIKTFQASNGWLESFYKRHNIGSFANVLESAEGEYNVVSDWMQLSLICRGYAPKDIFKLYETGLYFRHPNVPETSESDDDPSSDHKKQQSARITLALCASMTGEKLTPMVIGKSKQNRCFGNINRKTLPVIYHANNKAWVTSTIFMDWLVSLDSQMKAQDREILLFLNNTPSHPKMNLTNVKLAFLSANAIFLSQPLDQGIIRATKLKYRKKQLIYALSKMKMDIALTGLKVLGEISIVQAIYWLSKAWQEVNVSTIQKWFAHMGLAYKVSPDAENVQPEPVLEQAEDVIPDAILHLSRNVFNIDFYKLPDLDKDVHTRQPPIDWSQSAQQILSSLNGSDLEEEEASPNVLSITDAQEYLKQLTKFALHHGNTHFLNYVMELQDISISMQLTSREKHNRKESTTARHKTQTLSKSSTHETQENNSSFELQTLDESSNDNDQILDTSCLRDSQALDENSSYDNPVMDRSLTYENQEQNKSPVYDRETADEGSAYDNRPQYNHQALDVRSAYDNTELDKSPIYEEQNMGRSPAYIDPSADKNNAYVDPSSDKSTAYVEHNLNKNVTYVDHALNKTTAYADQTVDKRSAYMNHTLDNRTLYANQPMNNNFGYTLPLDNSSTNDTKPIDRSAFV